jgi:hypothetical protein
MKTRLLKKLRKEAKRYIHLSPCGFEESYNHDTTQVEIRVSSAEKPLDFLMEKYMTHKDYLEVDGVEFTSMIFGLSWGWCGECKLNEAKKILRKLRREYILQEVKRLRDERWFNDNKKEYEKFKKYIASL